jgi:molybdopterin converting factor small subunit
MTRATPAGPGPGPAGSPAAVTFRLFASARAAAGTAEVQIAPGPTAEVVAAVAASLPPRFADVLASSSLLADGVRLDHASTAPIAGGTTVDVLPPFAGG